MSVCPGADLLAAYAAGTLHLDARQEIEIHVADCSECVGVVADVAPGDHTASAAEPTPGVEPLAPGGQVGPYHVLGPAGRGATGIVYGAYDPRLDRKVALKVLRRPRAELEERLLREARAMARLQSAHVVAVHDVGTFAGGVFIAMDFIEGSTLREWLAERKRPWRDVLGAFLQAGRGLEAAHAAGIVHRDFKPDNVLVRPDGRLAVTDFGLARTPAEPAAAAEGLAEVPVELTATGALVGTPAYMAPEQLRGGRVDARSDLFSFCVALYGALFGQHPFPTSSLRALTDAASRGAILQPPGSGVPRHVRQAVLAGLRPQPEDRPASMTRLLYALERDPRRRFVAAGVAVAAAALAATAMLARPAQTGAAVCRDAERKLAGLWDTERRTAVRRGFERSGSPLAADTARVVERVFDAYAVSWVAAHTDACEATRLRGEQSEAVLDHRIACLDERRARWAALERSLEQPSAPQVEQAALAAYDLLPVATCADPHRIEPPSPPPAAWAPLVALAHASVTRARALAALGSVDDGLRELAPALAVARATAYRPLMAEARLVEGLLKSADVKGAEDAFHAAAVAAQSIDRLDVAAEAKVRLVAVLGWSQLRTDEALRWADYAQADVDRLRDRSLAGELLSARAMTYSASDRPERALPLDQEAVAVLEAELGPEHPKVALALNGLGIALADAGRPAEALPVLERAVRIRERALGPEHPETIGVRSNLGNLLGLLGRTTDALANAQDVLAARQRVEPPDHPALAVSFLQLCNLYHDLDRDRDAVAAGQRALAILEHRLGPDHPRLLPTLHALSGPLVGLGDYDAAVATAQRAVAIAERHLEKDHPALRKSLGVYGIVLEGSGRCAAATPVLARVVAMFEAAGAGEHPDVAFVLDAIGRCAKTERRFQDAEAALLRGLEAREKALGPSHSLVAESLIALSETRRSAGASARARPAAERAVAILEAENQRPAVLAAARFELAQALWLADPARARAAAEQSLAAMRALPPQGHRAEEVAAWLAARR